MDFHYHSLPVLFDQLGLPTDMHAIDHFIERHSPLPASVQLADAPFWSPSQAGFLREEILGDSDWAEVVDELNARMHG